MPNLAGLASQASSALSSTLSQAQSIASGVTSQVQSALQSGQALAAGLGNVTGALGNLGKKLGLSAFQTTFGTQDFKNGSILKLPTGIVSPEQAGAVSSLDTLRFPLDTPKYFVRFTFTKYSRPQALQTKEEIPTLHVILPMPPQLVEDYGIGYKTPELGAVVGAASDLVQRAIAGTMDAREIGQAVGASFNRDAGAVAAKTAAMSVLSKHPNPIISGQSEAVGAAVDRALGAVPNPHLAVIFERVNLRNYSFTYRFSPNSDKELQALKKIVKEIKRRILPQKSGEAILTFPQICNVSFGGIPKDIFIIKDCVVEDLRVNYTPQGSPAFFKTGDPVEVEITMSLKEIEAQTAEDIK